MKKTHITIIAGLLAAVLSLTCLSCTKDQAGAPVAPERQAKIEQDKKAAEETRRTAAATVNGVDITMQELIREMNLIAQRDRKGEGKVSSKTMDKVKQKALDDLIFKELAVQEAARQGITVSSDRIDAVIKQMKSQAGSEEAYRQYLEERALSETGLRKVIERGHQFELITAKEVYQKIRVEEKDVRKEYGENSSLYKDGGRLLSYEEAAPIIKKRLMADLGAELKKEWEQALRKKAKIKLAKNGK